MSEVRVNIGTPVERDQGEISVEECYAKRSLIGDPSGASEIGRSRGHGVPGRGRAQPRIDAGNDVADGDTDRVGLFTGETATRAPSAIWRALPCSGGLRLT